MLQAKWIFQRVSRSTNKKTCRETPTWVSFGRLNCDPPETVRKYQLDSGHSPRFGSGRVLGLCASPKQGPGSRGDLRRRSFLSSSPRRRGDRGPCSPGACQGVRRRPLSMPTEGTAWQALMKSLPPKTRMRTRYGCPFGAREDQDMVLQVFFSKATSARGELWTSNCWIFNGRGRGKRPFSGRRPPSAGYRRTLSQTGLKGRV